MLHPRPIQGPSTADLAKLQSSLRESQSQSVGSFDSLNSINSINSFVCSFIESGEILFSEF
jgi:hypothetical protein